MPARVSDLSCQMWSQAGESGRDGPYAYRVYAQAGGRRSSVTSVLEARPAEIWRQANTGPGGAQS